MYQKNDTGDIIKLSHYTSNIDALVNICSGEFWATDIQDFGDKNEGRESDFDNSYIDEQEYRILINTDLPTKKYPRIAELIPEYYYNDKNGKHYNILNFDRKSIKAIICNSDEARKAVEKKITDIPIRMRKEN